MRTLLSDPPPAEFEQLLEHRRRLGLDCLDEVWEGVLHMAPAPRDAHAHVSQQLGELLGPLARADGLAPTMSIFNMGDPDDYRIPDGGLHRVSSWGTFAPTAALVVEIVSPGDESWKKLPFYAAHHVDEVLIVDPAQRTVDWLTLEHGEYRPVERSRLIELGPSELTERLDWP